MRTKGVARNKALALGLLFVSALLAACLLLLAAKPAHADTAFTVDRSDDPQLSQNPTVDDCTAVANDCSLRGAISAANNTPGADTINFAIPGTGVKTIQVDGTDDPPNTTSSTDLPVITEAVTINGYTQPGASPNTNTDLAQGTNANLLIVLDGINSGSSVTGLRISASDVVVKGLVITRWLTGISIQGPTQFQSGGLRAVIEGNFIGTDPSGTQNPNNPGTGVVVSGRDNTIGGQEPAARNLISGNFRGLSIAGLGANTIQGNLIGTKANGTGALGNSLAGVDISASPNNTVGSDGADNDDAAEANLIAFNSKDGVLVSGGSPEGNRILSNSIFSNGDPDGGALGIDLDGSTPPSAFGDGVTPNDLGDGDTGPNNLQNFPELTSAAISDDGSTTIEGTLNSTPSETFTIQFFLAELNPFDPSDHPQGKTYLGQKSDVTTDDSGNASFSFTTQENVPCCQYVTATATRLDTSTSPATPKDTSEFSEAKPTGLANDPPVNSVPGAQGTNEDSPLVFSQANNNQVSVSDPDAGILGSSTSMQVRLQVDHGTMTLGGTSGLSFGPGDSGTNDADMTFTGSLSDVNAALDGMRFDPAANYNGGATLTITTDDQGNTGAGGAKTDTDTVSITVSAVNDDTPTAASQSVTTNEDTVKPITLTATEFDGDDVTFEITSTPTNGTIGTIGSVSCTGTAPKTCSADVTYTPKANFSGSDSFKFRANDATTSSDEVIVSITVEPVNDAPSFTKGPNQSVQDKAGARSVANWATNISVGPPNESAQSLQFILTSDNNALFTATGRPAVSSNGTLSYTPRVNANGTANVDVVARDSGGTANGGVEESPAQSFTITVNDATAPTVRSITPTNGLKGVAPASNVTATFSEAMNANTLRNPTTLRSNTFTLVRKNTNGTTTRVAAIVTYNATTKKATLNPDTNLRRGATYIATVTTGAKDLVGNALDQNPNTAGNQVKTWRFTVRV